MILILCIESFNVSCIEDDNGKYSIVLNVIGCNFDCCYCKKFSIVMPKKYQNPVDLSEIKRMLIINDNIVDSIVIKGGEPTLQKDDLIEFLEWVREKLTIEVSLVTNGTDPVTIKYLIDEKLVDRVELNMKTVLDLYEYNKITTCTRKQMKSIKKTFNMIKRFKGGRIKMVIIPNYHTKEMIDYIQSKFNNFIRKKPLVEDEHHLDNNRLRMLMKHG